MTGQTTLPPILIALRYFTTLRVKMLVPPPITTTTCQIVALEGLIGVGKSTLTDKIKRIAPNVEVLREHINPALLELFYTDPIKYGFAMQWAALLQRIYQSRLLMQLPDTAYVVWDRSMLGDYAFALWNHLSGNIDAKEMAAYESMFGGSARISSVNPMQAGWSFTSQSSSGKLVNSPFVKYVDHYLWLVDHPMECKRRVELRRSDPAEQGIPDSYYQGLEDVHIFLFLQILSDPSCQGMVKVRRWDQYCDTGDLAQLLESPGLTAKDVSASARLPQQHPSENPAPELQVINPRYYPDHGIRSEVAEDYGFVILSDHSKTELYRYLTNGGDPDYISFAAQ